MHAWRSILGLSLGFCTTAVIGACTPPAASGNCAVDSDCPGRGQYCEPVTNVCKELDADYTKTDDDNPPASFTGKPIPFFRGQVCTAMGGKIQSGTAIPLTFKPCLHPCMTEGNNFFQHQWSCLSGICSAMSVFYTVGDGDNCPAEAWGEFPKDQCNYAIEMSTKLGPVELDGTPVDGVLRLEIPFLTNSDLERIVDYKGMSVGEQEGEASDKCVDTCSSKAGDDKAVCLENCLIKELAYQYLETDERVVPFEMAGGNPTPPETCEGGNAECQCFEIGFG